MRLNYTLLPVGSSEFIHLAQFREETESLARQSQTESRAFCVDCTCLVVITSRESRPHWDREYATGSRKTEQCPRNPITFAATWNSLIQKADGAIHSDDGW